MAATNWAGNYTYQARAVHTPSTVEQVQELVAAKPRVRVLGSRHSFSDIADSDELLTLEGMPGDVVVDRDAMTVAFGGAVRYGDLALELAREGLALANLASLPHISVAGAVSTATHGSGDRVGNLATAVAALEIVTSDGDVLTAAVEVPTSTGSWSDSAPSGRSRGSRSTSSRRTRSASGCSRDSDGMTCSSISMRSPRRVTASACSRDGARRSTRSGSRAAPARSRRRPRACSSARRAATRHRHPILDLDPVNCTPQLGIPGPWAERLPHFRMGFTPSAGDELQSEYLVPRRHGSAAVAAVLDMSAAIRPVLQVSEIRTIAADRLWMSPEYGRDTVAIHFTWSPEPDAVGRALARLETTLAPFDARPHWGKLFRADATAIAPLYERLGDFRALLERLDPRGVFRNDWLRDRVLGGD